MFALIATTIFIGAPAETKPTIIVAPLNTSRTNSKDAETLSRLLRVYVGQSKHYLLVAPEDLGDIDEEIKRQLSGGCNEASCIAEIGGALGAKFMITGSFDRLGRSYVLTLKFIDIERVAVVNTVALREPTVVSIANALPDNVDELLGAEQEPIIEAPPAAKDPSQANLLPLASIGAGVLGVVAAGWGYIYPNSGVSTFNTTPNADNYDAMQQATSTGNAIMLGGVVAAGVGGITWYLTR